MTEQRLKPVGGRIRRVRARAQRFLGFLAQRMAPADDPKTTDSLTKRKKFAIAVVCVSALTMWGITFAWIVA